MNNPMQMFQMINQLKNSGNPMGMLQGMMGGNPEMQQMLQMSQGKGPSEMKTMITNLCNQRGIPIEQAQQMAQMVGLKW